MLYSTGLSMLLMWTWSYNHIMLLQKIAGECLSPRSYIPLMLWTLLCSGLPPKITCFFFKTLHQCAFHVGGLTGSLSTQPTSLSLKIANPCMPGSSAINLLQPRVHEGGDLKKSAGYSTLTDLVTTDMVAKQFISVHSAVETTLPLHLSLINVCLLKCFTIQVSAPGHWIIQMCYSPLQFQSFQTTPFETWFARLLSSSDCQSTVQFFFGYSAAAHIFYSYSKSSFHDQISRGNPSIPKQWNCSMPYVWFFFLLHTEHILRGPIYS